MSFWYGDKLESDGARSDGTSLVFQFPNWSLQLPDYAYQGPDPDGYASKDEFIRFLEDYASSIRAPVCRNTEVFSLRDSEDGCSMDLATARGVIRARNVVVATGPFQAPKIPALSLRTAIRHLSDTLTRLSKPLSNAARCRVGCRQRRVRHADRRGTSSQWSQGDPRCWPISQDPPSV